MTDRARQHLMLGSLVAGYRLERVLGSGGTGVVYLARPGTSGTRVALKILDADISNDPAFRDRFVREAELVAELHHPNIVGVYGHGATADGLLWMAMRYVAGTDADAELRAGRMPPERAVRIVSQVAAALDYAHARALVHRDVKPANFLLAEEATAEERVLLADFVVAQRIDEPGPGREAGVVLTTPAYASPEVLGGNTVDGRADVYSLGCSLFRLLTGKPPFFDSGSKSETVRRQLHSPPPRTTEFAPWLPEQIDRVITTAMAKDPAQRYQSAGALAQAAALALTGRRSP